MITRSAQQQTQLGPISEYVWLCVIKQYFLKNHHAPWVHHEGMKISCLRFLFS